VELDAVAFLSGLFGGDAEPEFDPDRDDLPDAGSAAVIVVEQSRRALRHELAEIVRNARRQGDLQAAADALEVFNHRAGVMQFDGGLDRHESERQALLDVLPRLRPVCHAESEQVALDRANPSESKRPSPTGDDFDATRDRVFSECNQRMQAMLAADGWVGLPVRRAVNTPTTT